MNLSWLWNRQSSLMVCLIPQTLKLPSRLKMSSRLRYTYIKVSFSLNKVCAVFLFNNREVKKNNTMHNKWPISKFPNCLINVRWILVFGPNQGAVPATIGIIKGRVHVGLTADQLELLATMREPCLKTSRRDLPYVLSKVKWRFAKFKCIWLPILFLMLFAEN